MDDGLNVETVEPLCMWLHTALNVKSNTEQGDALLGHSWRDIGKGLGHIKGLNNSLSQ